MKKLISIVSLLGVVIVLGLAFSVVLLHTDMFRRDFQVMYVQSGKQRLYGDSVGNNISGVRGFVVNYPLWIFYHDFEWDIVPAQDFRYYVDGEEKRFGELESFKDVFRTNVGLGRVTVDFNEDVHSVLAKVHAGQHVELPENLPAGDLFRLEIRSPGDVCINVGFTPSAVLPSQILLNPEVIVW